MKEKKPYLDKKLSLKQVALELDISTNYLSQVINENLQQNFFDFVNSYRIEEMILRLKNQSNRKYTLLAIAYSVGFNSKTTFNASFNKLKGQTPRSYLKEIKLL